MKLTERVRAYCKSDGGIRMIVLLGLAGMALILLSGLMQKQPQKSAETPQPAAESAGNPSDADGYRIELEQRLTAMLARMEGVGAVTVMITVSGSAEQIYAEEVKSSKNDRSVQSESAYVITKANGSESALVAETKYPAVQGVAVLCSGGDRAVIQERVCKAVATVLGIPASRIYVGKAT